MVLPLVAKIGSAGDSKEESVTVIVTNLIDIYANFTVRCRIFFSIQFLFGQELQIIIARQFSKAYVSARTRLSWFHLELTLSPPLPPVVRAPKYGTS